MIVLYIALAVVILLFMVMIHEFGHYCIGRMLNFKITEFSIGFGKALISRKNKRGELISLRLFPLGGYCAFAGEDEVDANDKDAFTNQAPWKRILVFLAGVTFNFATAVIFSLILLCTVGYDVPQVKKVELDTTSITHYIDSSIQQNFSDLNTLKPGDVIISIEGQKIDFAYGKTYNELIKAQMSDLSSYIKEKKDYAASHGLIFDEKNEFSNYDTFTARVRRGSEYKDVEIGFYQVEIEVVENGVVTGTEFKYYYGVNASAYVYSFTEGLQRAVPFAFGLSFVVLKSLWQLITFQIPLSAVGGPITTITTIAQFAQANFANLLILIPLISANLAVFNALPIPALDGAHVVFTLIEWIRKKPIKREIENLIHTVGIFILFGAVILIDILHFVL